MPIIDVAEENGPVCVLMEWMSGILQKAENGRLQLCRKELHLRKGIGNGIEQFSLASATQIV